jgi:NAD+-dependent protein deacetylase sirtuin 5
MFNSIRALTADPNAAHQAIALLSSSKAELKRVAPEALTFRLITQAVDGLSNRAMPLNAPPSAMPIEIYGNLFRVKCTKCGFTEYNFDSPICDRLGGTEAKVKEGVFDPDIERADLPMCRLCSGLLRPGVVWFNEATERHEIYEIICNECDLILVVGTALQASSCSLFSCRILNVFRSSPPLRLCMK